MSGPTLETERLVLRRWRPADRDVMAAINTGPAVMAFLGPPLTRAQSDAGIDRIEQSFDERGFGLWAVDVKGLFRCIGFLGLSVPRFEAHFTPCVEIGWRLDRAYWGLGYAPEGARTVLAFAFDELGLDEVVSFTASGNDRSRRVMDKIGLTHDPADDFDHPNLPEGDPLRSHVLYRVLRP